MAVDMFLSIEGEIERGIERPGRTRAKSTFWPGPGECPRLAAFHIGGGGGCR